VQIMMRLLTAEGRWTGPRFCIGGSSKGVGWGRCGCWRKAN